MSNVSRFSESMANTKTRRLCACAIDVAIVVVPFVIALALIQRVIFALEEDEFEAGLGFFIVYVLAMFALLIVQFAYYTQFHHRRVWTPGKKALGLRLVSHRTGERATKGTIVGRQAALAGSITIVPAMLTTILTELTPQDPDSSLFLISIQFLIFAPMLLHPEGRGWHDLIAGTVVVRAERNGAGAGTPGVVSGW